MNFGRAVDVQHLLQRNEAFGLEPDVDNNMLVGDLDDGAGDDDLFGGQVLRSCGLGRLLAVKVGQCRSKVGCVVVRLFGAFGGNSNR